MLGFDTDKPDIFARQLELVEEAHIVHSSVGMVTAIPKTPLHARLAKANRLDLADRTEYGTNIIPVGMGREELRDGYLEVLRELYSAKNFFRRMDALYLDRKLGESKLRERQSQEKPMRRYLAYLGAVASSVFVFVRLQTVVKDRELRRDYRKMAVNVLRRRPNPFVLQAYAIKSIAHYHYHTLINGMTVDGHLLNMF